MVEFRLYYDDQGKVLFYTCEQLEGNYIVIDSQTYAECRPDIRIIDGKIVKDNQGAIINKLVPSSNGISCALIDINIITDDITDTMYWDVKRYEHRYS